MDKAVSAALESYQQTGADSPSSITGRKCAVHAKRRIGIAPQVYGNPRRNILTIANDLQMCGGTIGRNAKKDLGMKSCKMQHRHLILAASKAKRLDRTKQMLEEMCSAGTKVFIWSAERIFTVEHDVHSE